MSHANLVDLKVQRIKRNVLNKTDIQGGTPMDQIAFYYLAFFLTIGSFLLGFVVSWNLKHVFDTWEEKADYAEQILHPEMYDADGEPLASPDEILYLRFTDVSDTIDDEEY